ncbi:MAG TPA: cytochrome c oxidase subunit 2A [Bacillota bacterium]|nr:cytochrome c oxidase subunit 2A [Bacillota bacterium]
METTKTTTEDTSKEQNVNSLKGTLASVLLMGGFIALLWFLIWGIYMVRV